MSEQKPLIYGIIHIGSSNLSLRIVEYKNVNEVRVIESVRKDTNFGEEVFNHKNLSFASIRKLCRMLNGLKQLLSDYQVKVYAAYATAVFREADNCRSILDLIRVKTGFNVQVVDMPQEIYFKHFGLSYQLKQYNRAANERLGEEFPLCRHHVGVRGADGVGEGLALLSAQCTHRDAPSFGDVHDEPARVALFPGSAGGVHPCDHGAALGIDQKV